MNARRHFWVVVLAGLLAAGCPPAGDDDDSAATPDAGAPADAGTVDANAPVDAGTVDAGGTADSGTAADAGFLGADAGGEDAARAPDGGAHDGGVVGADAGPDADAAVAPDQDFDDPEVTLSAGAERLAAGGTLPLQWTVKARGRGAMLFLVAREPSAAALGLDMPAPGTAYPVGPSHWLGADGQWQAQEVPYGPAADGSATVVLPAAPDGRWRLGAYLRLGPDGGRAVAASATHVVVGTGPQIFLEASRVTGTQADAFRVELVIPPGSEDTPVKVLALLQDGAHNSHYLPGQVDLPVYLVDGPLLPGRFTLLDGALGPETGSYVVRVRLTTPDESTILGAAALTLSAYNGPNTVEATTWTEGFAEQVTDVDTAASYVLPVNLDSRQALPRVELAEDGSFTLTLPNGRYVLLGHVVRQGVAYSGLVPTFWGHAIHTLTGGTQPGLYLLLDPASGRPVAFPAAPVPPPSLRAPPPADPGSDLAPDGHPRPRLLVRPATINEATPDTAELLADAASAHVFRDNRDVSILSSSDLKALMDYVVLEMLLGTDDPTASLINDLGSASFAEFILAVVDTKTNQQRRLTVDLVKPATSQILKTGHEDRPVEQSLEWMLDALDTLDGFYRDPYPADGRGLLEYLRSFQDLPIRPVVKAQVTPQDAPAGTQVSASATLQEAPDGPGEPNKEVKFVVRYPGGTEDTFSATTDASGRATVQLPAGNVTGGVTVRATFSRGTDPVEEATTLTTFNVRDPQSGMVFSAPSVEVQVNQGMRFRVEITAGGAAVSTGQVHLSARGGKLKFNLEDPQGSTLDLPVSSGFTEAIFTGGPASTLGGVDATYTAADGTTIRGGIPFLITGLPTITIRANPEVADNGAQAEVSLDVRMNDAAVPRVPVQVESMLPAQPRSGFTDGTGHFATVLTVPADGNDTAMITLRVFVEGQPYERSVRLFWGNYRATGQPLPRPFHAPGQWSGRWGDYKCMTGETNWTGTSLMTVGEDLWADVSMEANGVSNSWYFQMVEDRGTAVGSEYYLISGERIWIWWGGTFGFYPLDPMDPDTVVGFYNGQAQSCALRKYEFTRLPL